jgi:hypothetical protein
MALIATRVRTINMSLKLSNFVHEAELQQSRTPFGRSLRSLSLQHHKAKSPPELTKGLLDFGASTPSRSKAHRAFAVPERLDLSNFLDDFQSIRMLNNEMKLLAHKNKV